MKEQRAPGTTDCCWSIRGAVSPCLVDAAELAVNQQVGAVHEVTRRFVIADTSAGRRWPPVLIWGRALCLASLWSLRRDGRVIGSGFYAVPVTKKAAPPAIVSSKVAVLSRRAMRLFIM